MNKNLKTIIKRLLITIFLYAAYRAGNYVTLFNSASDVDYLLTFTNEKFSLLTLSFLPAATGYFLVEIIFLLIPKLRAIRNEGFRGREIINSWAIGTSFVIAAAQAIFLISNLSQLTSINGGMLLKNQSVLAMICYVLFYVVGFALVFLIAKLISKYGIGNGFCILIGLPIVVGIYQNSFQYIEYVKNNNGSVNFIGYIILISVAFLILKLIKEKDWKIEITDEKISSLNLPFFLQGAGMLSLVVTTSVILKSYFPSFAVISNNDWSNSIFTALMAIPASFLGYWMFSSRNRIASNLNIEKDSFSSTRDAVIRSTAALFVLTLIFCMPFPFERQVLIPTTVSLLSLIILIAIITDLKNQWMFHLKTENFVEVCELDNVHYASAIKYKLKNSQIEFCIQAYHYRQIFFFLDPLVKMKLLVSKEQAANVAEILNSLKVKNV